MRRSIAGIAAGFLLWTALWLGFNAITQAALPDLVRPDRPLTHSGVLLGYIAYSVLISALAGYVCAAVKRDAPMKTVWAFALVQLLVGIGFEASYWSMTPVWYHLVFLALIVPATVWGGSLRAGGRTRAAA